MNQTLLASLILGFLLGLPKALDALSAFVDRWHRWGDDLARLGRKTWTTTKTMEGLENHLWLYVAWVNKYPLR